MAEQYLPDPDAGKDLSPIMFIDRNGQISMTSIDAITAQIYDTTGLNLEEAAKMAAIRDEDEANNFMASFVNMQGAVLSIQ